MNSQKDQLNKVAIGIGMMLVAMVLLIALFFGFSGAAVLFVSAIPLVALAAIPIGATAMLLGIIGPCLCLAAPQQAKATEFILLTVVGNGLAILIFPLGLVVTLPWWLLLIGRLLPFVASVVFILFLKRLALYLERPDIAKLAVQSLVWGAVAIVLGVGFVLTLGLNISVVVHVNDAYFLTIPDTLAVFCVAALSGLFAFLRYLRTLVYTRRAILTSIQQG